MCSQSEVAGAGSVEREATDPLEDLPWPTLTALVLGATGMIGRHTVSVLLRRGVRVRALVRPSSPALNLRDLPVERIAGDLEDSVSLRAALSGCDLLFHCAAPYPRSHFRKGQQVERARRSIETLLRIAREMVPPALLESPPGHLARRSVEQAEGAAAVLRYQPERAEEVERLIRDPGMLVQARSDRLNSSLHPPLIESLALPGLKRIIYVSSLTTIGRSTGRSPSPYTFEPVPTGEDLLANESDRYDLIRASSPYFEMKLEMEAAAMRAAVEGMPIVIANPSLCVDGFDAAPTTGKLLRAVARKQMPAYLPGIINVVATRDVGEALVNAAALGRTGRRYILGGENLSARAFLARVARIAGVPAPIVPIPIPLAEGLAWLSEVINLLLRRPWPWLPLSSVQMMKYSQPFDCRLAWTELRMPRTPVDLAVADALRWLAEAGLL